VKLVPEEDPGRFCIYPNPDIGNRAPAIACLAFFDANAGGAAKKYRSVSEYWPPFVTDQ
jgi:hypothetical protein